MEIPDRLQPLVDTGQGLYERTERWHGPLFLVFGSAWDWLTLGRIDRLFDNLYMASCLIGLAVLLVLERRAAHDAWVPALVRRHRRWTFLGTQFLYGALYSGYVFYYAKSTPIGRGLIYVGLLLALLVVNELANRHLRGDLVRLGLFYFCAFCFLLFFVPVVTGSLIGFVTAGLGAMALTAPVIAAIHVGPVVPEASIEARTLREAPVWHALGLHGLVQVALLAVLVGLGRADVIPPVPLALKYGGVFHDVTRTDDGYRLVWEQQPTTWTWRHHDAVFRRDDDQTVWCFTAIFAPTGMTVDLRHRWTWWDPTERRWVETDRLDWRIHGGRGAGWRGFTHKQNLQPGSWRIHVETEDGRELGAIDFEVRDAPRRNALVQRIY